MEEVTVPQELTEHVHCAECGRQIVVPAPECGVIRCGQQFSVLPSSQGLELIPRQVPLCDACYERISAEALKSSKLIVPPALVRES